MFDIGFSEIVVVAVVALIVIGPEKLPKTARTLGLLFGRLQRYVNDVKTDINREIELDELRKLQQEVKTAATEFHTSMNSAVQQVESGVRGVESDLNAAGAAEKPSAPQPETKPLANAAATESPAMPALDLAAISLEPAVVPPDAQGTPPGEPPHQATLPGFDRG